MDHNETYVHAKYRSILEHFQRAYVYFIISWPRQAQWEVEDAREHPYAHRVKDSTLAHLSGIVSIDVESPSIPSI